MNNSGVKPFVVGVFGMIGAGKSSVISLFAEKGFVTWDADSAVSRLYEPGGAGAKKIGDYFDRALIKKDGSVSKLKLAKMVLGNHHKMRILEQLIHPLLINEVQRWIDVQKQKGNTKLVIEALAFEIEGLAKFTDVLVRVTAPVELCRERVLARGKDLVYFEAMLKNARDYATAYEIVNNGSFDDLKKGFEKVYTAITIGQT